MSKGHWLFPRLADNLTLKLFRSKHQMLKCVMDDNNKPAWRDAISLDDIEPCLEGLTLTLHLDFATLSYNLELSPIQCLQISFDHTL